MSKYTIKKEHENFEHRISYPSVKLGQSSYTSLPDFRLEIQFASCDCSGFARAIDVNSQKILLEVEIPAQNEQNMQVNTSIEKEKPSKDLKQEKQSQS